MMKDNQRGITLVELLGVLAILSVIILLVGSAHLFGQKQLIYQTDELHKQGDVRLVISQLTTDFRSVTATDYSVDTDTGTYQVGTHTYSYNERIIYRDGKKMSDNIAGFTLTPIEDDEELVGINIKIDSKDSDQAGQTTIETAIYFRR